MLIATKGDIVREALKEVAIASDATLTDVEPPSMSDGITVLEMMMADWYDDGNGLITGYIFSDPDTPPIDGDEHGMRSSAVSSVVYNLAVRICSSYGIEPRTKTIMLAKNLKERVYKVTALSRAKRAPYPSRMPIGSGNSLATLNGWHYFPGEKPNADSTTPPD